jgi:hypothetical protein
MGKLFLILILGLTGFLLLYGHLTSSPTEVNYSLSVNSAPSRATHPDEYEYVLRPGDRVAVDAGRMQIEVVSVRGSWAGATADVIIVAGEFSHRFNMEHGEKVVINGTQVHLDSVKQPVTVFLVRERR